MGRKDKEKVLKDSFMRLLLGNGVPPLKIFKIYEFIREKFEELNPYVDDWFVDNLKNNDQFSDRMAELYFIDALLSSGLSLEHKSGKGLDIWIKDFVGWGEFVCCHNTKEMKSKDVCENARIVDFNDTILRITSVLNDKIIKIRNDIAKGNVQTNESVILFISIHNLIDPHPMNAKGDVCSFLKALFPISDAFISIDVKTRESSGLQRKYELGIPKKETIIENNFFLNEANSMVSAVVFSYNSIFQSYFCPNIPFKSGDDFVVVHNPLAKNPIPTGLLNCEEEYVCEYKKGVSFSLRDVMARGKL